METNSAPPRLPPIDSLNQLSQQAFVEALKPLFETAPPLAVELARLRPYRSYAELINRAERIIAGLSPQEQVAVINAHPRIGESAAAVKQQSLLSYREQGYDAEASLDDAERERIYRELAELNRQYEEKFGFKFVVFVNRRPKSEIIKVLRDRMQRTRQEELATAVQAMLDIARDRLATLLG